MPQPIATQHETTKTTPFETAVLDAHTAIDMVWENADGLTLGDLRKAFVGLREKIDHYVQEIGH